MSKIDLCKGDCLEVVDELIERVYDIFDTSFIYNKDELILHKKCNIYFRINDIKDEYDFNYKLLSYCSFYCASNHFKKNSKECRYIWHRLNRWFRKDFSYDELQLIYRKIGTGANRKLGNDFIKSNLDFTMLKPNKRIEDTVVEKGLFDENYKKEASNNSRIRKV